MMEVVRNEGARTLTAQCRLSLWKPVYHLVKRGIDVNKQDEHGQTPLCAAMAAPTEPYRHFGMGSLGGLWPQQFMRFRLDDETRQELVGSQRFVVPCLSGRRVPDKECIIELLLKAGANPNLVPNNQCNSPNWLWARAFKSSAYNLPLVRALILANADVCCPVPDYHKDKLGGDADMTLLDCTFEICRLRLARYTEQEGSVMIICPNTDCFFKIMRCTIRCLELMRIAGATIFQRNVETAQDMIENLNSLAQKVENATESPSNCDIIDIQTSIAILDKLCKEADNPQRLSHLCRLKIRNMMRYSLPPQADSSSHPGARGFGNKMFSFFRTVFRKRDSALGATKHPKESILECIEKLEIPRVLKDYIGFAELRHSLEVYEHWIYDMIHGWASKKKKR